MVERSRRELLARTVYSFCVLICLLSVSTIVLLTQNC